MSIRAFVASILVIGFLSVSLAQENNTNSVTDILEEFDSVFESGIFSNITRSSRSARIVESQCKIALKKIGQTSRKCLTDTVRLAETDISHYVNHVYEICDNHEPVVDCIRTKTGILPECSNATTRAISKQHADDFTSAIGILCNERTTFKKCWADNSKSLHQCAIQADNVRRYNSKSQLIQCSADRTYRDCVMKILNTCPENKFAPKEIPQGFESLWNVYVFETPCSKASSLVEVLGATLIAAFLAMRVL